MEELEAQGLGCSGCQGNCCTYEANSMMVTPIEAVELVSYLKAHNELTTELKEKVEESVRRYRLDHPSGNGRRAFIRRTYTCPFFGHKELGCPLPRNVKPYGCLAFNAHHSELKAGEHCYSEKELLLAVQEEKELNEAIKVRLGLVWEKTPLPLALLDLWDRDIEELDCLKN